MLNVGKTSKRCDSRSMAAAGTKLQGRAVDEHDSRENVKAAGVKRERSRRYDNNECFVCGKQGHKQWDCPQSQLGKAGKGVHGQTHGQTPVQQQQSPSGPAKHTRATQPEWPLRLPPIELVRTRRPQRRWLRRPKLLRLNHVGGMTTTTCTFACRGKG